MHAVGSTDRRLEDSAGLLPTLNLQAGFPENSATQDVAEQTETLSSLFRLTRRVIEARSMRGLGHAAARLPVR